MMRLACTAVALAALAPLAPGGAQGAPPALPRALPTFPESLASAPCTRTVGGSQLQSAVNRARAGMVLCLRPGEHFVGQLTLPRRDDAGWVVIRTTPVAGHPAPGERVRPSHQGALAHLATTLGGAGATVRADRGARGWYLALLDITIEPSVTAILGTIVNLPRGASDIVLDRVLVRAGASQQVQRCVALNSANTAIIHSWLDECHAKGYDSQAVVSWESDGPVLLDNNTLAGAGENIMLGGADAAEPGVSPQDWTITRNHIVTPVDWKGRWTKKNLFETKNARRILVERNVLDGSWTDGQVGFAFLLKSANQSGGCTWCSASDLTIRRNLIVRAAGAFGITGREGSNDKRLDSLTRRVLIAENYADGIGREPATGAQQLVAVMQGVTDLVIERNTLDGVNINNDLMVAPPRPSAVRLVFRRNALTRGQYSLHGCGGPIANCLPGGSLTGNVFVGSGEVPPGNRSAATMAAAIAMGAGISRGDIDGATRGVVVQP